MVFLILDSLETLCCPSHHASHADQSILTIITSSLYSAIGVPEHISVSFMEETTFTGTNTGDDGILIANYILRDNLSTRWNYNDLAFPKFAANIPLLDECLVRGNPSPRHESHHRLPSSKEVELRPNITKRDTLKASVPRGQCSQHQWNGLTLNLPLDGIIAVSNTPWLARHSVPF